MKNPFLAGERVYLRALDRDDVPTLTRWFNDRELLHHLKRHRPLSPIAEEKFVESLAESEDDVALVIVAREGDRMIGVAGLHDFDWKNRSASFGIGLGERDEWQKGYGREATRLMVGYGFDTMNFHRIWLHVYDDNARAIRAYEAVGFRREGVLRQGVYREGRYGDVIVMGLLREEWRPARAP